MTDERTAIEWLNTMAGRTFGPDRDALFKIKDMVMRGHLPAQPEQAILRLMADAWRNAKGATTEEGMQAVYAALVNRGREIVYVVRWQNGEMNNGDGSAWPEPGDAANFAVGVVKDGATVTITPERRLA